MDAAAARIIETLGLKPHPEGGWFAETVRAPLRVSAPQGERSAHTAIYFLLLEGTFSALHRVRSDELWHHYDGAPLELTTLDDQGRSHLHVLGHDFDAGQRPQVLVPAGVWQAAVPRGGWSLCGCTVAPGFDFADFELPPRAELLRRFPAHADLVTRLTR